MLKYLPLENVSIVRPPLTVLLTKVEQEVTDSDKYHNCRCLVLLVNPVEHTACDYKENGKY
jgi:hypothetical protein